MTKKTNYTMISGHTRPGSYASIEFDEHEFFIKRDSEFPILMNNPLKTSNGFTVGQRNRAFLHAVLDAWIDGVEMPDDLHATDEQCARFNEGNK
jgi:hypothetical protein